MKLKANYAIKSYSTIVGIAFGIAYDGKTEGACAIKSGYWGVNKWTIGSLFS
jgi:hypothetical protein